jgi:hypothetical protein
VAAALVTVSGGMGSGAVLAVSTAAHPGDYRFWISNRKWVFPSPGGGHAKTLGLDFWPFSTVILVFLLARQAMGAALAGPSARRTPKWRGHDNGCA